MPYAFTGSFAGGAVDYGFTPATFADSFENPMFYAGGFPAPWGVKPYIQARTEYLRQNTPAPAPLPALVINEIIASNDTIIADEAGQFEDFIEILNTGTTRVDLSGMYLSDDPGTPRAWQFPAGTTIPPGGFLLVWADNDPQDGPLHATFGLSSGGETVALFHNDANGVVLIDTLTFPALPADQSFGRFPDATGPAQIFCAVTPAAPNDDDDSCFIEPGDTPRCLRQRVARRQRRRRDRRVRRRRRLLRALQRRGLRGGSGRPVPDRRPRQSPPSGRSPRA
jgi:hypothetical protein